MAVHQRQRRHWVSHQSSPQGEEAALKEVGVLDRILVVESIRVEFGDRRRSDDNPFGQSVLDDVQCQEKGAVECWHQTVVRRR